jgi:hypothetical protein
MKGDKWAADRLGESLGSFAVGLLVPSLGRLCQLSERCGAHSGVVLWVESLATLTECEIARADTNEAT